MHEDVRSTRKKSQFTRLSDRIDVPAYKKNTDASQMFQESHPLQSFICISAYTITKEILQRNVFLRYATKKGGENRGTRWVEQSLSIGGILPERGYKAEEKNTRKIRKKRRQYCVCTNISPRQQVSMAYCSCRLSPFSSFTVCQLP